MERNEKNGAGKKKREVRTKERAQKDERKKKEGRRERML